MAPPPAKDKRPKDPRRLDVSTPAPALKHSPFAALAGPAPTAKENPASAEDPANAAAATARPAPSSVPKPAEAAKSRGRLILRRETKHRGGKTVVIVAGFAQLPGVSERELAELLQALKQRLGCGGSVLTRELLLQGDRPAQVAALLREHGFRVDGVTS